MADGERHIGAFLEDRPDPEATWREPKFPHRYQPSLQKTLSPEWELRTSSLGELVEAG